MKPDYLYGTDYKIFQREDMFHHNSDTELLGRFAKIRHQDSVLDVGCGNGALLLYAAVHSPVSLTGIDIDPVITASAAANLKYNDVKGEIVLSRLQDYQPDRLFSVILCNPPYFRTLNAELVNEKPLLALARHEIRLTPGDLFHHVKRLLKDNGTFNLVHRPERIQEILRIASQNDFHAVRMRIAYDKMDGRAKTVLYAFRKGKTENCTVEKPCFLNDRSSF